MLPIDLALFDARDRALPGREMAELNALCRAIVELVRQPPVLHSIQNRMHPTANRRRHFFRDFQRSENWR
jgi:hypothetical protein